MKPADLIKVGTYVLATVLVVSGIGVAGVAYLGEKQCEPLLISSREIPESSVQEPDVAHENLTEREQTVFMKTLRQDSVSVDGTSPRLRQGPVVKYNRSYYLVEITHVECGELTPLFLVGGGSVVVFGLGLFALVRYRH